MAEGDALAKLAVRLGGGGREPPSVDAWHPELCGASGIVISADGTWSYRGSPIVRIALVRLFASVLSKDEDGRTYLVTPAEKLEVTVEDAPFLAVDMACEGEGAARVVAFRTNMDDRVTAGPDHPMRFAHRGSEGGFKPYIRVRGRLEALLTRALAFDLAGLMDEESGRTGLWSGGMFFPVDGSEANA